MTAPVNPLPIGQTASYTLAQELASYTQLDQFPEFLAGQLTHIVYIDPNNNLFHLNGPLAGMEGVTLGEQMQGEQHLPFTQVLIEGAFQRGATIQRTTIEKRLINFRVNIRGNNNTQYRAAEERWWAGQIEEQPGWLGVFSRFSGWRWTQVWPYSTIDTAQQQDPVAYGNNFATWDINWIAPYPYYSKPSVWATWSAATSGDAHHDGFYYGNLVLANRGDVETTILYQISGAGFCQVQDNNSDRMVTLPEIFASDGVVVCNTDPAEVPVTAQNDPHDNLLFKIMRASGIINFLLAGVADAGEPIWKRGFIRFIYSVPPRSATHFTVAHTNANATVTAILPQRYRRAR